MRNATGTIAFIAALTAILAHDASAQQRAAAVRRGWLGFSYENATTRVGGERRQALEVMEVVSGSPAERAGVQVGDTIISINNLRINDRFMESLSYSIAPGDDVRLLVRRGGRDRELSVTAGERPAELVEQREPFYVEISPDSIRRRMGIYLDSARIALDSMHLPRLRVERLPGGGGWMFSDSTRLGVLPRDSVLLRLRERGVWVFPHDSVLLRGDWSPFFEGRRPGGGFSFRTDSTMTLRLDSLGVQLRALPRGRIYGLSGDSLMTWAPRAGGIGGGIAVFGMRAVGGAELTELNPALGEYFGTDAGVLVVRVPEDTPAERAGLEAGDVIVKANGEDVENVSDLRRAIGRAGQRSTIRLEILRKKVRRTIELRED